ncbi:YeeE/YedE family protein [Candidatus Acetothermia bacterium]|nr:YeeE/YedE family protein [Candidatus Acetothermia bacterium]MBI3643945.1 YeeE/YedE family protein [Candidatus Acetothermia bacterium]
MTGKRHPLFMPSIFVGGLIFGAGLAYSQMARPEVVLSFLQLKDFGLLLVMGGATLVAGLAFQFGSRMHGRAPLTGTGYARRTDVVDSDLLFGGLIFGLGWGLSGICPGAAYASIGIGNFSILIGIAGMFIGAYCVGLWKSKSLKPTQPPARKPSTT